MFIDCHQHFWSISRGDYGWLQPHMTEICKDRSPSDLAPILQRHGIAETVLVQAAPSIAETDYLLGIADATPWVRAVVGWIDFGNRDHERHIERWARQPKFRAVRPMLQDIADAEWILAPDKAWAFDALRRLGLHFEFLGTPRHLETALTLAARYPDLRIILDHCMKPDIARNRFEPWGDGIMALAGRSNVSCKLSGLVTEARRGWTLLDLKPYADHVISAFGADRIMWGSDWPVLDLNGSYDAWRAVTLALVGTHPGASLMLRDTARRVYRID